ncbi:MAG: 23S rRNA (guanosine2251-2'-O)-methyltransferase [Candidatus Magnetoglobus multicellularis str. Araruama]|uniref:23S rRNA (Guanosine2251-2'-O)-methyltransferase n=1 Tax=Candidatus Magnetoglobus multicellularis str. Araruama TaxID=890399 RepID=A0A1V1PEZ5_9BACT|nr:MAG: 23S rRNA (guanosine2251-2'-O)-methyltransferase [Candidatus Magnetoglobus multicellularis str. Araruama]
MKIKNKKPGRECLYGIHPINEAFAARKRKIAHIYLKEQSNNPRFSSIIASAKQHQIPITYVSSDYLKQQAGHNDHQQIIAHVSPLPLTPIHSMITEHAFIIICDQIMDPHNMGAIMRTALACGVSGLITTTDHAAPLSATVSKISSGAMEHLPIAQVPNLVRCMKNLKQNGIWVYGLDQEARVAVYDSHLTQGVALVIGGEHKGIRRLVKETCDQVLHIPQFGPLDSLNASVAAGVAMYEVFRQRRFIGAIDDKK